MRFTLSFVLLALLSGGANAQAFGVNMGDPVSRHRGTSNEGISYRISVPQPNPAFEAYIAFATPKTGICKVVGIGKDYENDDDGTNVRVAFDKLQTALNARYGNNKSYDFLKSEALWDKDREFVWSILKKERIVATFWDADERSTLPPQTQSIALEINAVNSSASYITLNYEFNNYDECEKSKTAADSVGL